MQPYLLARRVLSCRRDVRARTFRAGRAAAYRLLDERREPRPRRRAGNRRFPEESRHRRRAFRALRRGQRAGERTRRQCDRRELQRGGRERVQHRGDRRAGQDLRCDGAGRCHVRHARRFADPVDRAVARQEDRYVAVGKLGRVDDGRGAESELRLQRRRLFAGAGQRGTSRAVSRAASGRRRGAALRHGRAT